MLWQSNVTLKKLNPKYNYFNALGLIEKGEMSSCFNLMYAIVFINVVKNVQLESTFLMIMILIILNIAEI